MTGYCFTSRNNIIYYTGVGHEDTAAACVVIPKEGEPVLITLWTDIQYTKKKTDMKVFPYAMAAGTIHDHVAKVLDKLGIVDGKFGVERDWMPIGQFEMLQESLPNSTFPEAKEIFLYSWIDDLRMVKTPDEIEKLRKAAKVTDLAMEAAIRAIKPGVTGFDIIAEAEYVMKKHGAGSWIGAHPTLVAYGELLNHAHPFSPKDKIENNGLITIDLGAVIEGYHSDLCRTIALGKITKEEEMATQAVLNGQTAAIEVMRSGVSISDVQIATLEGFGDYKKYHFGGLIGHGLGLGNGPQAFDSPFIAKGDERKMEKNTVWALIEIPPFVPGVGAPRFEDAILITDDKPELLTKYPRELIRI
ncbi:MAG: M24 family metallopeptidase [Lachnotalea sp.]